MWMYITSMWMQSGIYSVRFQFQLDTYLSNMFEEIIPPTEEILVAAPNFFKKLGALLNDTATTKTYVYLTDVTRVGLQLEKRIRNVVKRLKCSPIIFSCWDIHWSVSYHLLYIADVVMPSEWDVMFYPVNYEDRVHLGNVTDAAAHYE